MELSSLKIKKLIFQEGIFQLKTLKKHSKKISYIFSKKAFLTFIENETLVFCSSKI